MNTESSNSPNRINLGLAMLAGLGFTIMAVALGTGAIQGTAADGSSIGLGFVAGLALSLLGLVGWLAIVQPYKHFDDINVPQDTGHHHDSHDDEEAHG